MPWLLGITVAVAAVTAAVEIFGHRQSDADKAPKSSMTPLPPASTRSTSGDWRWFRPPTLLTSSLTPLTGGRQEAADTITGSDESAKSLVRLGG